MGLSSNKFAKEIKKNEKEVIVKLAKVTEIKEGKVYITFFGEETQSLKNYKIIHNHELAVGDVVCMISVNRSWIIIGRINIGYIPSYGGGDPSASDAELLDIRIGANGKIYPSAGAAVREQFREKITPYRTKGIFEWDGYESENVEKKTYTQKFTDLYPGCGVTHNAYCSQDVPGNYKEMSGYVSIHKIAAVNNDIIRIDGAIFDDTYCRVRVSNAASGTCMSLPVGTDPWNEWVASGNIKQEGDVWYIKLRNHQDATTQVEFSFRPKNDEKGIHISKNQEIAYDVKTEIIEGEEKYTNLRLSKKIGITITPYQTKGIFEWDGYESEDVEKKTYIPKFTDLYPSCGVTQNAYCSKDIPGNYATMNGYVSIHKIAAVTGDVIRIDGAIFDDTYCRVRVSNAASGTCMSLPVGTDPWNEWVASGNIKQEGDVWYIKLRNHQDATTQVEFSFRPKNDEKGIHISKNQEIAYEIKVEVGEGEEKYINLRLSEKIGIPGMKDLLLRVEELEKLINAAETIPDYVQKNIVAINARLNTIDKPNVFSFAYMADIHADVLDLSNKVIHNVIKRSIQAINEINREHELQFVGSVGDHLMNNDTATKANCLTVYKELTDIFEKSNPPVVIGKGNHDDNTMGTTANSVQNDDRYMAFGRKFEKNVIADAGNVEKSYWYKDFESHKIRLIMINTSDIPYIVGTDGTLKYKGQWDKAISHEQLQFVSNALKFSEPGWGVIFMSHHALYNNSGILDDKGSDGYVPDNHGGNAIRGIIAAYKGKKTYNVTSDLADFKYNVNVDYSGNASAEVICCISGHTHRDLHAMQDGTLLMSTTCASPIFETENEDGSRTAKVYKTSTETSWDIISVNRKNRKIYTSRYGAGKNREYAY